jgi:predicted lipid-binding transport protein (Tim44 family)
MKALIAAIVVSLIAFNAPAFAQTAASDSTSADQSTTPKVKKAKKKMRRTAKKAKREVAATTTAPGQTENAKGEKYREGVTAK